jgi:phenylpyruvate tautomerase PptA (4-oxalocrotonate tautomerase family)
MPLIEVKAFDRRFEDEAVAERLIARLTDAMCEVFGEPVRDEVWVVIEGVSPRHWGFGGKVRA